MVLRFDRANFFNLSRLRNPWGSLVWNGDWSDKCDLWTEELRRLLVPEGAEEGIFWISFKDLCQYFDQVIVCKIRPTWKQYGYEGVFPTSFDDQSRWTVFEVWMDNDDGECQRAQLSTTLYQDYVKEHDDDEMEERKPLLAIFVAVFELLNTNSTPVIGALVGASICNIQSSVTCECELEKGRRYLVAMFGFNNWQQTTTCEDINTKTNGYYSYVLRLYSSIPLKVDCFQPNPSLLGDIIIQYVKKYGEVFKVCFEIFL